MDVDKCIKERRTVSKFKNKSVSWGKINEILEAMLFAPNSGNLQNWKLVVLKNKGNLNLACYNQESVHTCDFLVVVCSDDSEVKRHFKENSERYCLQNTAAGIENMLLKAHSLKINSCWIGSFDKEKVRAELKIPDNINIHAVLAFGYSDEKPEMPLRTSMKGLVFFDYYGNKKRDRLPIKK